MAIIKFEIDTSDASEHKTHGFRHFAPPGLIDKVGLLASIRLEGDLIDAFNKGLGQRDQDDFPENAKTKHDAKYAKPGIEEALDKLLEDNRIKVIATAGGLVVMEALRGRNRMPRYVSLVGQEPEDWDVSPSNCRGGVSLQSPEANLLRRSYLVEKGHKIEKVVLLTNSSSKMHETEKKQWADEKRFLESYVGKRDELNNPINDPKGIPSDWGGDAPKIPDDATAVIISDDPFFMAKRAELIEQGNAWLANKKSKGVTAHIVYPSAKYKRVVRDDGSAVTPTSQQSIMYGPDLVSAYRLLGILAHRLAIDKDAKPGFFPMASQPKPVP